MSTLWNLNFTIPLYDHHIAVRRQVMFFIKNFHPPVHCCFLTVGQPGWCIVESTYLPPIWLAQFLPLCMFLSCSKGFSPVFLPSQKLTSSIFYLISIWSGQRILSKCYEQCKNFCQFSAVYLIRVPFQSLDSGTFSFQNICNSVTLQLYCSSSKQPSSQNPVHFS